MFCYKAGSGWLLWIECHKHGSRFLHKFGLHSDHMVTVLILVAFILSIMAAAVCSYTSRVQDFLHQGSYAFLLTVTAAEMRWSFIVVLTQFPRPPNPTPPKQYLGRCFWRRKRCSPWLISRETHIKTTEWGHHTGVLRAATVEEQEIMRTWRRWNPYVVFVEK